jgi:xanthine dehydrogenase molybdopterin-binding subunit B
MPISEAFNIAEAKLGTLAAVGHYNTPKDVHGDYRGGTIGASPAYSFTAHVAEVEVDVETGFVAVDRIWIAHDCGRALNPVLVEGQMEGSAYMGFAEALMEEQIFKDATTAAPACTTRRRCSTTASRRRSTRPLMTSLIIESLDPEGPYGAKEAGEGPLHPSIPAIANAIYDAVGVRMDAHAVLAARLPAPVMDESIWTVEVRNHTATRRIGDIRMSQILDCGSDMTGQLADTHRIRLSVRTWLEPAGGENTEVRTRVDALASSMERSATFSCSSRGELEARIAQALEERTAQ